MRTLSQNCEQTLQKLRTNRIMNKRAFVRKLARCFFQTEVFSWTSARDVGAKMLIFPGFGGPDRSFWPDVRRDIRPKKLPLWAEFSFLRNYNIISDNTICTDFHMLLSWNSPRKCVCVCVWTIFPTPRPPPKIQGGVNHEVHIVN